MFVSLSGIVNAVTVQKQWTSAVAEGTDTAGKARAFKKILRSQVVRGFFIIALGFVSENLLNGALLSVIMKEGDIWVGAVRGMYLHNVLRMIGAGTIIVAVLQLVQLKKGVDIKALTRHLVLAGVVVLVVTLPLVLLLQQLEFVRLVEVGGVPTEVTGTFWRNANDYVGRDPGTNILYFFLVPLVIRYCPIFPFAALSCFGAAIGVNIAEGKVSKALLNRIAQLGLVLFLIGFMAEAAELVAEGSAEGIGVHGQYRGMLTAAGGEYLLILLVFYFIDVRGKGTRFAQKTVTFRRFGLVTLTLWCLQWLVASFVILLGAVVGLIAGWEVSVHEGPFLNNGLNGWQMLGVAAYIIFVVHGGLKLWERAEFKYSFEWLTVKLLSRGRNNAGERLKLSTSLYNLESIIPPEQGQSLYSLGALVALFFLYFVMDILTVALSML
jgi:hypothetical protein